MSSMVLLSEIVNNVLISEYSKHLIFILEFTQTLQACLNRLAAIEATLFAKRNNIFL